MTDIYASIYAGGVEYSKESAAVPIDEFIEALETAKDLGATHVIGLSGNHRGAQFVHLGLAEQEED